LSKKLRIAMLLVGLALCTVFALWYPYELGAVPEWKLQVVDPSGNPVVGAQITQEWINPIEDGMISSDSRTTDVSGVVLFPKRVLHNRLALGTAQSAPSSRLFVCWRDEFGDLDWDGNPSHLFLKLVLKKGACPYG
jgi:hypothetical protein